MIRQKILLVVFDLDGVLLNSKENMKISWNLVNRKYHLKINFSNYFKNIGIPFFHILKKLKIKQKTKTYYKKIKFTYDTTSKNDSVSLNLYKGSKTFLKRLKDKNIKTCILTSKDIFRSKVFLKKFDIKVNKLITPEKIKFPKPHPFALNQLKKIYRIHYSNILFIGDTIHDYKCAKSAKVNYAHVNWGYGKNYKPKIKINNFLDLNKYFIF
jgi:HAD superfamily hydrolase (TIGR01549 family)